MGLSEELLSLVLEAPDVEQLEQVDWEELSTIPLNARGYLIAWLIVFDHFTTAVS